MDEVKLHNEFRSTINRANIHDIEWIKDGKVLSVTPEALDEWEMIGLNNIEFAKQLLDPDSGSIVIIKMKRS